MKKITVNTSIIEVYLEEYIKEHDLTYTEELLLRDCYSDIFEKHWIKESD